MPIRREDPDSSFLFIFFSNWGGGLSEDLPQVAEINTPRVLDVAGEYW